MSAYYNEVDPYAAEWLRNLIKAGHIADGVVDDRSIIDVEPTDLAGFHQCHFFAGVGIWSYALRCAGVDDDVRVWTGSAPCQPFSQAGRRKGFDDERHLWPVWARLIEVCRPDLIFGEQVSGADGRAWWDAVAGDLEGMGYAAGAIDSSAAGVGAPHIRPRLYWVANADGQRRNRLEIRRRRVAQATRGRSAGRVADAVRAGWKRVREARTRRTEPPRRRLIASRSAWRDIIWLPCVDGKLRPTQPGLFPLAASTPRRVGQLRAYGNGLCAPQAEAFITAALDALEG